MTAFLLPEKPEKNEKLYQLSVSKAKTFNSCPKKFRFHYIEKLPRKEWEHHVFGTFVHDVLENFHKRLIDDASLDQFDLMTECFKNSLEKFKDKITKEQKVEAFDVLKDYLFYLNNNAENQVIAVEKPFYLVIDDVLVLGFIDRLQIDSDGVLHISDYKTNKGGQTGTPKQKLSNAKKYLKDFFQLKTYAYVLMLEDPSIQKIRTSFMLLRHKFALVKKEFTRDEIMSEVEQTYLKYAADIREEQLWRANPGILCKFCDWLDNCEEGKQFLRKIGQLDQQIFGQVKW